MLTLLGIVYAIVCILLVIVVMLQSGKAGNMGLFGGGGSSSIGAQGGDIMTRITTILGVLFFVFALAFAFLVARDNTASRFDKLEIERSAGFLAPGETPDAPIGDFGPIDLTDENTDPTPFADIDTRP